MEVTGDLDLICFSAIPITKPDWNGLAVPQNVKQILYDPVIILQV